MLLTQMVVGLDSLLLLAAFVVNGQRDLLCLWICTIHNLLHTQWVRSCAPFQVRGSVLGCCRALHALLAALPILSNWNLLLIMRMHRPCERLIMLWLVVVRLDGGLAVDLLLVLVVEVAS